MAAKTLQESNFQEFIQEFKDVQQPTNNIPCLKIQGPNVFQHIDISMEI